jgi:hypothetical protein
MNRVFFAAAAIASAIHLPAALARDIGSGAASPQITETAAAPVSRPALHYEWQYHYVGHHPRFEGHWVLVR